MEEQTRIDQKKSEIFFGRWDKPTFTVASTSTVPR